MQTFNLELALACSAVIPKHFLAEARAEAQKPDASQFLKLMQEKFPEDDDQFMLAVVKNAFRTTLRVGLLSFMSRSGVGGSVSPVQITGEKIHQGSKDVEGFAVATDPDNTVIATQPKAEQVRVNHDSPGTLINGLVQERAE